MTSEDIYDLYLDEIVIQNSLAESKSGIYKKLGEKSGRTAKAAYMLMKRMHAKKRASASTSAQADYIATDGSKRVVKLENAAMEKSPDFYAPSASENDRAPSDHTDIAEGVETAKSKSIASDSYSGQFPNAGIFEIETRTEKHRQNKVVKNCVKAGWTSKLATLLFKETEISCKFNFKRTWILADNTIRTNGTCDCGSELDVFSDSKSVYVNIKNIKNDFNHSRKYQVRGQTKEKVSEMLKSKTAHPVQVKLVNEFIPNNKDLSERFDTLTPTLGALQSRRSRQEATGQDSFLEVVKMKESDYADVISFVCHSPFAVFYQTPLQLAIYIATSKSGNLSLSIDATGSLVTPPKQSAKIIGSKKLKHVFLYQIMMKTVGGKSVPVAQAISQDGTSEFLEFFFRKTFKNIKIPKEFVTDECRATLKALATTFAGCNGINSYNKQCTESLLTGAPKPSIQLRFDRSHFAKNVSHQIKDRDYRRQFFFRGVVGYLIQCDNFDAARNIVEDFFTVILNEFDGTDEMGALPAETSKKNLLALLSSYEEDEYTVDDIRPDDESDEDDEVCDWIQEIINNIVIVKNVPKDQHANLYYNPNEKLYYMKLFSTIPLWSNVTNSLFETTRTLATTADCESNFKTLKTGIIGRTMLSPHKFLKLHIDFVNAEVKLRAGARRRSNSLDAISPDVLRKKSSFNHYEYHSDIETKNGIHSCLSFHILVNTKYLSIYILILYTLSTLRKRESVVQQIYDRTNVGELSDYFRSMIACAYYYILLIANLYDYNVCKV